MRMVPCNLINMDGSASDTAFAALLTHMGMVSAEDLEMARRLQAKAAERKIEMPLAKALVHLLLITEEQKEKLEKYVAVQQQGGLTQLGNYRLLRKLGAGNMGAVYLAEDEMLGRHVALKVLSQECTRDPMILARFKREAVAAGKLNHENIVGAFAVGEELGYHFYVMEYWEGENLDLILQRKGCLPESAALAITMQAARGLEHAHAAGLIHRDVKPANILITPDGVAKILDLGLAKDLAGSSQISHLMDGQTVGTPDYISPEQVQGLKNLDGRTDVYSLGATFYHLLTGHVPFEGETAAVVMTKHLTEDLTDPRMYRPELSEGAVQIVFRAMAKTLDERYQNMGEMLAALESVAHGRPLHRLTA